MPLYKIVPVCYPIFSMGEHVSKYYMNDKIVESSMKWNRFSRRYETKDITQAQKTANILRVGGYNCVIVRRTDGKEFPNWASNNNGHYLPMFMDNHRDDEEYYMYVESIVRRRHSWMNLPLFTENITFKMELTYLTMKIYHCGKEANSLFVGMSKISNPKKIIEMGTKTDFKMVSFVQTKLEKPIEITKYQDFMSALPEDRVVYYAYLDRQYYPEGQPVEETEQIEEEQLEL